MLRFMIDSGADPRLKDARGHTLLSVSKEKGGPAIKELALEGLAKAEARDIERAAEAAGVAPKVARPRL